MNSTTKTHWTLDDIAWDRFDPTKVNPEILKLMINNLPMDLKTVSTYHAAFEWTGLNYTARGELCYYLERLRINSFTIAASA